MKAFMVGWHLAAGCLHHIAAFNIHRVQFGQPWDEFAKTMLTLHHTLWLWITELAFVALPRTAWKRLRPAKRIVARRLWPVPPSQSSLCNTALSVQGLARLGR